mmetsp:Transcript_52710/g.136070  ORF Transcript_52710/g.136070 Transcript_52710/m.136070 type:complete len:287 (+) Transcript_52710:334-1194(+)
MAVAVASPVAVVLRAVRGAVSVAMTVPVAAVAVLAAVGALVAVAVAAMALAVGAMRLGLDRLVDLAAQREVDVAGLEHLGEVERVNAQQLVQGHGVGLLAQGALRDGHEVVDAADGFHGRLQLLRRRRVDLVQEHLVREGNLLRRLVHGPLGAIPGKLLDEVDAVYDRDHAVDLAVGGGEGVAVEGLADRARVGHAGRLDQDAVQAADRLVLGHLFPRRVHDVPDRVHQVATHRAAEAPVVQQRDRLLGLLLVARCRQELAVYAYGPELVLDDRVPLAVVGLEDVV